MKKKKEKKKVDTRVPIKPALMEDLQQDQIRNSLNSLKPGDTVKKVYSTEYGTQRIRAERYSTGVSIKYDISAKRIKKADYEQEIKMRYNNGESIKDIA